MEAGADFVTMHVSAGMDALLDAIEITKNTSTKILAITILTSLSEYETNLIYGSCPKAKVLQFTRNAALAGAHGIVCSPEETEILNSRRELKNLLKVTPGIRPAGVSADDQQRIADPKTAMKNGADFIVIGRPILQASDPLEALSETNKMIYEGLREKLALDLFNIEKIKFGAFRLKLHDKNPSAPLSPIYLDLRNLPEKIDRLAGELMAEQVKDFNDYTYVIGIPNAGEPFARVLIDLTEGKFLERLSKVETTTGRYITKSAHFSRYDAEARQKINAKGLLVDDLITQADSKLEALNVLNNEMNIHTDTVLVLVDREQGGKEQLEKKGYKLKSVFSLTHDLLPIYVSHKKISREKAQEVIKYIEQNQA